MTLQLVSLDQTDLRILKELQKDERMNYAETSRRTRVPPSTVYDKIARLADKGDIKKVTVIPDREKVGFGISALIGIDTGAEMRVHYMISVTPLALS